MSNVKTHLINSESIEKRERIGLCLVDSPYSDSHVVLVDVVCAPVQRYRINSRAARANNYQALNLCLNTDLNPASFATNQASLEKTFIRLDTIEI